MSIKRENNDNLPLEHTHDAVAVVEGLLNEAVGCAASDIHFEPTKSALIVKFRLDGELKIVDELPKSISDTVISRLKVLGGLLKTDMEVMRTWIKLKKTAVCKTRIQKW